MKTTHTTKINIFLIIFIFSLFSSSCDNFLQPPKHGISGDGNGYISLSIGGVQVGRTIVPLTENNIFDGYDINISSVEDDGSEPIIEDWEKGTSNGTIGLKAGKYNLKVTAYMFVEQQKQIAAQGIEEGIEIKAGQRVEISLKLTPNFLTGKGTFCWNISCVEGINATNAIMTIFKFNNDGVEEILDSTPDLKDNYSNLMPLDTGFYLVVIKLTRTNGEIEETAELREILYIYQNLKSVLNFEFKPYHFTDAIFVISNEDNIEPLTEGSLRWAIAQAENRYSSKIIIDSSRVKKIELKGPLEIVYSKKDITIEGNGVTITGGFNYASLLEVSNTDVSLAITIRRVHFTGGDAPSGGAVYSAKIKLMNMAALFIMKMDK